MSLRLASIVVLSALGVPHAPQRAATCMLTMSGAHAASVPCTANVAIERGRNVTAVTITGDGAHLVIRVRGNLAATRFASDDAESGAALGVHLASGAYWFYSRDVGGQGTPPAGSYELVLHAQANGAARARPGEGGPDATASSSGVSGTFSAKLPSGRMGGGVLTVTAQFE